MATEPTTLPVTYRSAPVLRTAILLSVVLLAATALFWIALDPATKASFTPPQAGTLLGIVLLIVIVMLALGMSAVTVRESGVVVRNGFVRHRLAWDRVIGVSYGGGDPWPNLELRPDRDHPEGRTLMLLGIQRVQGEAADDQVRQLRTVISQHTSD